MLTSLVSGTRASNQSPCTPNHQTPSNQADEKERSPAPESEVRIQELIRRIEQGDAADETDKNPQQDSKYCDDGFHLMRFLFAALLESRERRG